jgi:hypothetical protein
MLAESVGAERAAHDRVARFINEFGQASLEIEVGQTAHAALEAERACAG